MDLKLIVVIIAAVVAIGAVFYARSIKTDASSATLSAGQALGAGIVGLGILMVAMPWAAGQIADMLASPDAVTSSNFAILAGAVYGIGIVALIGGILLVVVRGTSEA